MSAKRVLNILLAEDNEVNQAVIEGMLGHVGHRVDSVANGCKAIEALAKSHYDLVIMDCLMPVMDGFEAARAIRASTSSILDPMIPILAITALVTSEDRARCLDAGMTACISKPVIAGQLFAWLDEHFGTGYPSAGAQPRDLRQHENTVANPANTLQTAHEAQLREKMSRALERDLGHWQVELMSLFESGQLDQLGALAHKIRGTADVFGYTDLSIAAAKLEKSGRAGEAADGPDRVSQLVKALIRLMAEIGTRS